MFNSILIECALRRELAFKGRIGVAREVLNTVRLGDPIAIADAIIAAGFEPCGVVPLIYFVRVPEGIKVVAERRPCSVPVGVVIDFEGNL